MRDLRSVLAERGFRRLFATRLVSQAGDGLFTSGLGTYVFFNATSFPDPGAAAAAFAVLYLPYSLIGPFAGVFIDRWPRRHILAWSPLLRTVFVLAAAALVGSGQLGVPLYAAALLVFGVNRFFLSALSAGTPHVVPRDKLVLANSVAPTSGTIMTAVGLLAGTSLHLATGGGPGGSAAILLCGGVLYLAAGLVAMRMPVDLLGPAAAERSARASVAAEVRVVAAGLAAGLAHIAGRRRAAAVLTATALQRFLYGILLLMSILLYRNFFYARAGAAAALSHYLIVGASSAVGYAAAAVVTPWATRRLTMTGWVTVLLAAAGIGTAVLGAGFTQAGFIPLGFLLGLVAQGVTIATTTIIQQEADDDFLGRVFSVNDMLYNGAFSLGAAACAAFMPLDGRSYALLLAAAAGYAAAAPVFWLLARQPSGPPGGFRPPASAQASSS